MAKREWMTGEELQAVIAATTGYEWTWDEVNANAEHVPEFEYVDWLSAMDAPLIWNGLRVRAHYGRPMRTPRIFKTIHDEALLAAGESPAKHFSAASEGITMRALTAERGMVSVMDSNGLFMYPPDEETLRLAGFRRAHLGHRLICLFRGHQWGDVSYMRFEDTYRVAHVCIRCQGPWVKARDGGSKWKVPPPPSTGWPKVNPRG